MNRNKIISRNICLYIMTLSFVTLPVSNVYCMETPKTWPLREFVLGQDTAKELNSAIRGDDNEKELSHKVLTAMGILGVGVSLLNMTIPTGETSKENAAFAIYKMAKWFGSKFAHYTGIEKLASKTGVKKWVYNHLPTPAGLKLVQPKSASNPDGALHFDSLLFDPFDKASSKIRSTVHSISKGDPMKNGIYYGDAGTGKSASVKSFSHLPNFKVYSINGDDINFSKFVEITHWLKIVSSSTNKIIVDISEGDKFLQKIALDQQFKNFFKQNYDRHQAHFALIFSCNFNQVVSEALEAISGEEEMKRRLEDRINFSNPSAKVRLSLLKSNLNETIKRNFDKDQDIYDFFNTTILKNPEILKNHVIPNTEGMSHSRIITLAEKLVYLYVDARHEENIGVNKLITEFDFVDQEISKVEKPIVRILNYLNEKHIENQWLKKEKQKFIEKYIERLKEDIPVKKLEKEYFDLVNAIENGDYSKGKKKKSKNNNKNKHEYSDFDDDDDDDDDD